ncbi:MAG TPA: zf-HC2 domain-containing protein [Acidobacteriota bacterium]|nr:zf-HC2 domain-containing protein [Acidobacteriota bacterium]
MSEEEKHFELEIQDLIDGRLDSKTRQEVESHISKCEKCRSEFEQLDLIKKIVKKEIQTVVTPENIKSKILHELQSESTRIPQKKFWFKRQFLAAAAIVVVLIVAGVLLRNMLSSPFPSLVAKDYRSYVANDLILGIRSNKAEEIEDYFRRNGIPFHTRVFDLAMMQYHLQGGKVHQLSDRPSALFVYNGSNQRTMVCQMFPGSLNELPRPEETRNHNGIRFLIYKENEITMVFWQEAEIICVLTSDADKEDVIQLAFAKAVKV